MNQTSLRAVFTLNEETHSYVPVGHNLTQEKAESLATRLQSDGLRVATAPQPLRHSGRYRACQPCKTAAENLSGQQQNETDEGIGTEPSEESQTPR